MMKLIEDTNLSDAVWLIQHEPTGLYWIWCYSNKEFAERMAAMLDAPRGAADRAANWRANPKQTCRSDRTGFDNAAHRSA